MHWCRNKEFTMHNRCLRLSNIIFTWEKSGLNSSDHVVRFSSWNVFLMKSRAFFFPVRLITWWRFWLKCLRKDISDALWSLSSSVRVAAVMTGKQTKNGRDLQQVVAMQFIVTNGAHLDKTGKMPALARNCFYKIYSMRNYHVQSPCLNDSRKWIYKQRTVRSPIKIKIT